MQQIKPLYTYEITGNPYVKKSNQRTVPIMRNGRPTVTRIDTPRYRAWHASALEQLMVQPRPTEPIMFPINLQCRFYMLTNGRVDLSALYEGIQDVLVEMGILEDDNWKIVASHDGSGVEWDKFNPRMEITITKKETKPWQN